MPNEQRTGDVYETGGAWPQLPVPLRDWFAGQWAASQKHHVDSGRAGSNVGRIYQIQARDAYAYADAMLAERDREADSNGEA